MRNRLGEPRTYLIAIALAVAISANPGAGAPLDIPIPEDPTLEDILSTSNGGGEVQGIVPGAGACDSAAHRAISLPADDRPHNNTEFEYGYISDADGNVTTLRHGDFTATPTRFWRRDATCEYPVDWDVDLGGIHLHAQSVLDGAEMRPTKHPEVLVLFPSYAVPFWDGETVVSGDGTGRGWVDVTHYCAF